MSLNVKPVGNVHLERIVRPRGTHGTPRAIPMNPSALLFTTLVIATLGGCAHIVVYDEARDKQAQEAKRAASELKTAATVRTLEKGYTDATALEVESATSMS